MDTSAVLQLCTDEHEQIENQCTICTTTKTPVVSNCNLLNNEQNKFCIAIRTLQIEQIIRFNTVQSTVSRIVNTI